RQIPDQILFTVRDRQVPPFLASWLPSRPPCRPHPGCAATRAGRPRRLVTVTAAALRRRSAPGLPPPARPASPRFPPTGAAARRPDWPALVAAEPGWSRHGVGTAARLR